MICNDIERRTVFITEEEREENFNWVLTSSYHAKVDGIVQCRGCWEWYDLCQLYRCFHCGSWFCTRCSYQHFGPHPEVIIKEKGKS